MDKALNFLKGILKNGDSVVIGNSGGPDSMALTNILIELRKKLNLKIICAHVNHNLRIESKSEAEFLKNFCEKNNIIFEYMIIDKYGDDNFHNEARNIRYNFFESVVKKYNASFLMTAHHGDDLIETILMRIVRGSTLKGYAGFQKVVEKENYRIVRPLIYYTKDEIKKYDDEHGIPYVIDKSNFKGKYTRNRYRKEVLPFLKKEDKNVNDKFLKFSNLLFEYDNFIEKYTKDIIDKICCNGILDIKEYKKQEQIIKYKIISKMLERFYNDDLILINDSHISLIDNLINSNKKNSFVSLPNNVVAFKTYNSLEIKLLTPDIDQYEIEIGKIVRLPNNHIIEEVSYEESNNNNVCRLLKEEVSFPLHVRTRKIGDRMYLRKIEGSKKVKDIFIDCKIPLSDRDTWPIVVDSEEKVIWIPGIKKSKFSKSKQEKYDIILRYQ